MIKSMTAYGRGEVETAAQKWVVELKSVNHRFLELALNLPRRFWALEDRFRKLIKSRVARGRVDMQLSWENLEDKSMTLRLDMDLVAGVRGVLEQLRLAGNTPESLKLEHFLHFSDLMVAKEQVMELELEATWEERPGKPALAFEGCAPPRRGPSADRPGPLGLPKISRIVEQARACPNWRKGVPRPAEPFPRRWLKVPAGAPCGRTLDVAEVGSV
jgi:hypothetical protein